MNWRSIRWKIVAAMMLVTLVTVLTVGLLTQALVGRELAARERDVLRENARAVARQALPHLDSGATVELGELAEAAGFLAEARVVIADDARAVVADTGPSLPIDEIMWIVRGTDPANGPGGLELPEPGAARGLLTIVGAPAGGSGSDADVADRLVAIERSGGDAAVIRRVAGPFGSLIHFGAAQGTGTVVGTDGATMSQSVALGVAPHGATGLDADEAGLAQPAGRSAPGLALRIGMPGVTVPIGEPDDPRGYVTLVGNADYGSAALAAARRALAFSAALALVAAATVGVLLSRTLTRPLVALAGAAERMGAGDLASRAPETGAEEIRQVGSQFNRMAERLAASFDELAAERDALRRFVSDASHELRTPITALANFNELLQGPAGKDEPTRDEFLRESAAQLDRLRWITADLLDLSRIEMGLAAQDRALHDVSAVLEAVAGAQRPSAERAGIAVIVEAPTPQISVTCDGARIEMALGNLVQNAVKFAPPRSVITLGADMHGKSEARGVEGTVRLWVHDDGPAIEAADVPRLFERFYRGRRAVEAASPGSGLGLSIVDAVARAHGGAARYEAPAEGGNRFVIALPLGGAVDLAPGDANGAA